MRLDQLLAGLANAPPVEVAAVCEDSRRASPGCAFVARDGTRSRGGAFARDAVARGAVAVVAGREIDGLAVPVVVVADPAAAAGVMAQRLAGDPTRAVKVLAVTGTNGKTTTCYLLRHLLGAAGHKCGLIGTVEVDDGRGVRPAEMTTPPAVELAKLLGNMRDNGCAAVAVEASSHALEQRRLAGVRVAAAGLTNLTGDHLDYHGTMDAYAAAKARLFHALPEGAPAVVNFRSDYKEKIAVGGRRIEYDPEGESSTGWRAGEVQVSAAGTRFTLHGPGAAAPVVLPLIGRHNVENALCAAAMVGELLGSDPADLAEALSAAPPVPGRLERVDTGQPYTILVDYAHTDDALDNVLRALRPLTRGRLRVVFGCGGDRDRTKRPRMAAVAERLADDLYVTSDNPRTEDPAAILRDIVAGLKKPPRLAEPDRRAAIRAAVADAEPADVVLVAGKGHEDYQIIGETRHHFDDREEAAAAVKLTQTRRAG